MYFWYCLEFDWTSPDLWFTTRFWISMTELFFTMNSFIIAEGNENQWIYQWICDIQIIQRLSYVISQRIIVFELFEHWTMLIVFLFLVLIISKFYSRISKKTWLNLQLCCRNPMKSVLFICPSDCLSVHFSQDLLWIF